MPTNPRTELQPVELSDGTTILMEVHLKPGQEEEISSKKRNLSFSKVTSSIKSMAEEIHEVWDTVKPNKMSVEFGVELTVDADNTLMAAILRGSGTTNFKLTLEWEREKPKS